ncbi:MAG: hypothetical protein VX610_00135 [SAR324 cluster bacterium]|nr:hypothetical protein [SAR324 cluster bacterium]
MAESEQDQSHLFVNEFAFENLKDKHGAEGVHPAKTLHRTKDGQLAQMQKQIADLTKRVAALEAQAGARPAK